MPGTNTVRLVQVRYEKMRIKPLNNDVKTDSCNFHPNLIFVKQGTYHGGIQISSQGLSPNYETLDLDVMVY